MEQAPVEKRIIKQCMRERLPLPKRIQDAPELMFGLELYYDAFWELSTCRSSGFGLAPIPWSAIREYALTFELDEAQEEDLFYLIRVMDNAYLKYHEEKKPSLSRKRQDSSKSAWTSSQKP